MVIRNPVDISGDLSPFFLWSEVAGEIEDELCGAGTGAMGHCCAQAIGPAANITPNHRPTRRILTSVQILLFAASLSLRLVRSWEYQRKTVYRM
jgi:hypothetical protein